MKNEKYNFVGGHHSIGELFKPTIDGRLSSRSTNPSFICSLPAFRLNDRVDGVVQILGISDKQKFIARAPSRIRTNPETRVGSFRFRKNLELELRPNSFEKLKSYPSRGYHNLFFSEWVTKFCDFSEILDLLDRFWAPEN